jgi:hypothetical protein
MEGPDTLGVPRINDEKTSYYYKMVPLPTYLNYQIDTMTIKHMGYEQNAIIKSLKKMIFGKSYLEDWYEVFLSVFVLLSTMEYVHQMQGKYLQRHQGTVRMLRTVKTQNRGEILTGHAG